MAASTSEACISGVANPYEVPSPEITAIQYLEGQIAVLQRELSSARVGRAAAEADAKRLRDAETRREQKRARRRSVEYNLLPPRDASDVVQLLEWFGRRFESSRAVAADIESAVRIVRQTIGGKG